MILSFWSAELPEAYFGPCPVQVFLTEKIPEKCPALGFPEGTKFSMIKFEEIK